MSWRTFHPSRNKLFAKCNFPIQEGETPIPEKLIDLTHFDLIDWWYWPRRHKGPYPGHKKTARDRRLLGNHQYLIFFWYSTFYLNDMALSICIAWQEHSLSAWPYSTMLQTCQKLYLGQSWWLNTYEVSTPFAHVIIILVYGHRLVKKKLTWVAIGEAMVRPASACCNRYQRCLASSDTRHKGMWHVTWLNNC